MHVQAHRLRDDRGRRLVLAQGHGVHRQAHTQRQQRQQLGRRHRHQLGEQGLRVLRQALAPGLAHLALPFECRAPLLGGFGGRLAGAREQVGPARQGLGQRRVQAEFAACIGRSCVERGLGLEQVGVATQVTAHGLVGLAPVQRLDLGQFGGAGHGQRPGTGQGHGTEVPAPARQRLRAGALTRPVGKNIRHDNLQSEHTGTRGRANPCPEKGRVFRLWGV